MLIDKLRKYLQETPADVFEKEWNEVEDNFESSPLASEVVQSWGRRYKDKPKIAYPSKTHIEGISTETPNYSEFFFNIVVWNRKQQKPAFI